jgi:hypothetical protein
MRHNQTQKERNAGSNMAPLRREFDVRITSEQLPYDVTSCHSEVGLFFSDPTHIKQLLSFIGNEPEFHYVSDDRAM